MHEGHRRRLAAKIRNSDSLYEHELLEILLFNACPRKNVNHIAHGLINAFGGVNQVLCASEEELVKVHGVGKNMAEYLVCLGACLKRTGGSESFAVVRTTEQFVQFIYARFGNAQEETIELYCLDRDGRIRRACSLLKGDIARGKVKGDKVMRLLSVYKPSAVYVAHYRADEDCSPLREDDDLAAMIQLACTLSGIKFNDYCIVCRDKGFYSYFVEDRI